MEKLNDIYEYVCSVYGIDIKKDTRKRVYVEARALYYLLSRNATRFSLQLIADIVGRDHASVIHGIENVSIFLDKEIVSAGYIHFDMAEKASKKTLAYLRHENKKLKQENILLKNKLKNKELEYALHTN